jgi:hypothetical protein
MNPTTRPPRPDADSPRDTGDPAYNAGMPKPSTNGRTPRGQFAKGNPGGPGNPHAKRVAWLREALLEAVSEDDLRAIARTLVKKAKGGDLPAIRELLNRVIGKAPDDAEASPPEVILVRTGVPEPENDWRT